MDKEQTLLLQDLIRKEFDNTETTFEECEKLIHLATALGLSKEFIEEMANDNLF